MHCPPNSCVKKDCVYGVYAERRFDSKELKDTIDSLCKNCFRCVQECKANAITRTVNPDYLLLGDDYWKPDIIASTWYQAKTGNIPVSGAGYRGPFVGPGFDEMWTDMSEIVRPTRDGIYSREYIATNIDLGRKKSHLEFDEKGNLISDSSLLIDLPFPVIFNILPFGDLSENITLSMAKAARALDLLMMVKPEDYLMEYKDHFIPWLKEEALDKKLIESSRMVALNFNDSVSEKIGRIKNINPSVVVSIKVPLDRKAEGRASKLTREGAEVIHLMAGINGQEQGEENPRFIKDVIRSIHTRLVEEGTRDEVTLIASGGIAAAEHLAKIMLCGADGCAIDLPLLIALECRVCQRCVKGLSCPVDIESIAPAWGARRIINLMGAWHSQLIEVMGAMGIREARRLRGEVGRAMFYQDLERKTFGQIFGGE